MASSAVGGLYIQVKLDEKDAIRQAKAIGKAVATSIGQAASTINVQKASPLVAAAKKEAAQVAKVYNAVGGAASNAVRQAGEKAASTAKATANSPKSLAGAAKTQTNAALAVYKKFGQQASQSLQGGFQILQGAGLGGGRIGSTLSSSLNALSGSMKGVGVGGGAMTAALVAGTVAIVAATAATVTYVKILESVAGNAFKTATNLETISVSFEALLGSASAARAEIAFLKEAAIISPYLFEDILNLDRFLLAQGVNSAKLRQGLVTVLTDFGAAAGIAGAQLMDIAYAIGQIWATGRLTGDEARQLTNNFLGVQNILRTLPGFSEAAGTAIKKAMENGEISAKEAVLGILRYAGQFEGAAKMRANTIEGLWLTIKDTFSLILGEAVQTSGALDPLRGALQQIRDLFMDPAFMQPLADALGGLFSALGGPEGQAAVGILSFLVGDLFPALIRITAYVVEGLLMVARVAIPLVIDAFQTFRQYVVETVGVEPLLIGLMATIAAVAASIILSVTLITTVFIGWAAWMQVIVNTVKAVIWGFKALWRAVHGDFAGAGDAIKEAGNSMVAAGEGIINAGIAIAHVWGSAFQAIKDVGHGLADMKGLDPFTPIRPEAGEVAPEEPMLPTEEVNEAITKALNELWDLTRRWFDLRSQLEQGLLGDEGFTATISSIASMGQKAIELARAAGRVDLANMIDQQTRGLLAAARRRDAVAKQLEEAQKRLADAITLRDSLVKQITEGALGFVNSMKLEEESVEKFRRLDKVGSFVLIKTKENKSFVAGLKERMVALRAFVANVKNLAARGLDKGLLESIIAAGPEQAGKIAEELNQASDATIGEVNDLQRELGIVAGDLGYYAGQEFQQAGVDLAQGAVDGLQSQLDSITTEATLIAEAIYAPLAGIAVQAEDLGAGIGEGIAGGLGPGLGEIDKLLEEELDKILGRGEEKVAGIGESWAGAGDEWGKALTGGFGGLSQPFDEKFDGLSKKVGDIFEEIKNKAWDLVWDLSPPLAAARWVWENVFVDHIFPTVKGAWDKVKEGWNGFKAWWEGFAPTLKGAWDNLLAGMQTAWELFKTGLGNGWDRVQNIINTVIRPALETAWSWVIGGLKWWWDRFKDHINGWLGNPFDTLVDAFRAVLNSLIYLWNQLDLGIHIAVPSWVPEWAGGGKGFHVDDIFPDVHYLAKGGVVTQPTHAIVGEAGPEAVLPLHRLGDLIRSSSIEGDGAQLPDIRVFIGDKELTDIVRIEIDDNAKIQTRRYLAGRRA